MSNAPLISMVLGWIFLIASWVWPSEKWGGRVAKIALAALATGVFLARVIYHFF